jgi:hypothetical protein
VFPDCFSVPDFFGKVSAAGLRPPVRRNFPDHFPPDREQRPRIWNAWKISFFSVLKIAKKMQKKHVFSCF